MTDIRQQSTKLLASTLAQIDGGKGEASSLAQQIEEAVYAAHDGMTGNAYRDQMRSVSLDLGKNNVELAKQLLSGTVSAQQLIGMGPEGMKSAQRAKEDEEMREQGLRESLGASKIPVAETGGFTAGPAAATDLAQEGEVGAHEASMGEEGDLKQRSQPKISGLEGIEFESGM